MKMVDHHASAGLVSDTQMPCAMNRFLPQLRCCCGRRGESCSLRVSRALLAGAVLLAIWAFPAGLTAGMPRAQKHESRHEIDQLEDQWREAVMQSNTAEMDKLLADDYMAITASGTLQTKDQALANLRAGRMHFTLLDISDRKVRFYGTTALVTSLADVRGTAGDGELSGSYRYTRVYVRDPQGSWKIVSFEASRIREPGERAEHH
jgi:ketosteroid isomerase-like protein